MRIALIAPEKLPVPPAYGGPVEITIHQLARRLQESHSVTVYCPSHPGIPEHESWNSLTYCRLPHQTGDQYLEALMQQLADEVFDVIHIFDRPQFVLSLSPRLAETKIILHLHSDLLTKEISRAEASACIDQMAAAVTNSHFLRLHTAQRLPLFYGKSRVIEPGVDLTEYRPCWEMEAERSRERQRMRLTGKQVVLFAGSFTSVEGLHILFQALRPLMRQNSALTLLLTGESWFADPTATPFMRDLSQLAQSFRKQIVFTGVRSLAEMPMIYRMADLLVCPSQWEETHGWAVLNAMASGLPVVASARGVLPEMVYHGRTGVLVHKHTDPIDFAKAITSILHNPDIAAELGRQGRCVVESRYRWERTVAAIERLHVELAGDR